MWMRIDGEGQGLLARVLGFALGAVLLVLVFTLSLLLFAGLAAGGLLVWGYLWWRTRRLRRELARQMREQPPGGRVIEGEVISDEELEGSERFEASRRRGGR